MKKMWFACVIFQLASTAFAADHRTFQKLGADSAQVLIKTSAAAVQAADYVDGVENSQFLNMMKSDAKSTLSQLVRKLEMDYCGENSSSPDGWIPFCGRIEMAKEVQTSFARGGWMEAGGSYSVFVGFREAGTGKELTMSHLFVFDEEVLAEVDSNGTFLGRLKKTLKYQKILVLPTVL